MKKKIVAVLLMAVMALTMAVGASAADGSFDIGADVVTPVTSAINQTVTVSNVVAVIVAGLGIALVFVLLWFGYRKLRNMAMSAMRSGKLGG